MGACKLLRLEKSEANPVVSCEITNLHPRKLQHQINEPVY